MKKRNPLKTPPPPTPPPPLPLPRHPLPPHFHHSPSPCSRILLYKPGTDVCRGRAERPRCSGCQPHAFHSEMKAHSSPSCEANFKKKKKKRWKKTNSPNAFKSLQKQYIYEHTFLSPLHHLLLPARAASATGFFFLSLADVREAEVKNHEMFLGRIFLERSLQVLCRSRAAAFSTHTTRS